MINDTNAPKTIRYPEIRTDGTGWTFRTPPSGFHPYPDFIFLFNPLGADYKSYERLMDYEKISENPDDYHRCIARERCMEIAACRHYGVKYGFIFERNPGGIHIDAIGDYATIGSKYLIVDADFNEMMLDGMTVFLRTHSRDGRNAFRAIYEAGAEQIVPDPKTREMALEWMSHIKPEFLGRRVEAFKLGDLCGEDQSVDFDKEAEFFKKFAGKDGKVFVKTMDKAKNGVCRWDKNPMMVIFGWDIEHYSLETKYIVSEPMEIAKDMTGKTKEYRCYVVMGKLCSVSRYLDHQVEPVPEKVVEFVKRFVEEHDFGTNASYDVDVCECEDGRIRVIEMNSIEGAGRYEGNRVDAFVIQAASKGKHGLPLEIE